MNRVFSCGHIPLMTKPWKHSPATPVHRSVPLDATPARSPPGHVVNPSPRPKTFAVVSQDTVISRIPCL